MSTPTLTHIDLFSGIGGFALAARWAGLQTVQFVEIDPFCQQVLKKHWPEVPIHDDIKTFTYANGGGLQKPWPQQQTDRSGQYVQGAELRPFLLTGGFPCQPFSCAGKRRGKEDDRFLWPEMLRVISEARPTWIIGENVAGFINMGLNDSISDLEREGYEVQTFIIPACAKNAPHRRDRVWIVAHRISNAEGCAYGGNIGECVGGRKNENISQRNEMGCDPANGDCHAPDSQYSTATRHRQDCGGILPVAESIRPNNCYFWTDNWYTVALRTCVRRVDDGLSRGVDRHRTPRLKALGNAIVWPIAAEIIKAMVEVENGITD